MPPSPLDARLIVALSRPVRPQELNLCLKSSYLESGSASENYKSLLSTSVVCLNAANLTYMPSSNGSARSLGCGCSSASCCTVGAYEKDIQAQSQAISSSTITSSLAGPSSGHPNQMVNNNENSGALSPSGGVGSPVSGATKQFANIKIIYPNDLAKKLTKCSKTHLPSQGPVIIDCRPFMEYNKSHIQGAVHINCSDKISRRRLQQGKITVLDLISCRESKDSFKRIFSKEIIVYDDNTNEPSRVIPSQPLHTVLESLKREGKEPLVLKDHHVYQRNIHLLLNCHRCSVNRSRNRPTDSSSCAKFETYHLHSAAVTKIQHILQRVCSISSILAGRRITQCVLYDVAHVIHGSTSDKLKFANEYTMR
uniref:Dual specificity phosphatase 10 n=1 Tax=Leptobrachium leishanense TaxID=445787 RepID=A0A8C5PGG7_9ANUR